MLRRLGHQQPADGVVEGGQKVVLEFHMAQLDALAQPTDHEGSLAEILDAAAGDDPRLAEANELRGGDGGLKPRAADARDGQRRNLHGDSRLERHMPRPVDGVGAGLQSVAKDGMVDVAAGEARFL